MIDNHETSADIISEIRERMEKLKNAIHSAPLCYPTDSMKSQYEILDEFADRLEAAHKREIDELKKQIEDLRQQRDVWSKRADELKTKCNEQYAKLKQAGDAAKLREALKVANETADELLKWTWNHYQELNCMGGRLKRAIEAALSAPPRNCDVGTAEEQYRRHGAFCDATRHGMSGYHCDDAPRCVFCFAKWARLPYEEGGAK